MGEENIGERLAIDCLDGKQFIRPLETPALQFLPQLDPSTSEILLGTAIVLPKLNVLGSVRHELTYLGAQIDCVVCVHVGRSCLVEKVAGFAPL